MSYRLNAIFILDKNSISNDVLLKNLGISTRLIPKNTVDFFETNNRWNKLFVGTKGDSRIICHGKTINRAFEEESFAAEMPSAEIAAVIWDEAVETFGFVLFKNGRIVRKVLVAAGEFEFDLGFPIDEESKITDDELLDEDEMEDIIESEGKAALQNILKTERAIHCTNRLVKRYLGGNLVEIEEDIPVEEYG
jgi:hypothetical protein